MNKPTLPSAWPGLMRDLTVKGGADCHVCNGTGINERREDSAPMQCFYCDGTGREPEVTP